MTTEPEAEAEPQRRRRGQPVDPDAPQVRVRFAPSPTGEPHVGNIRTALFSWLYARHTDGVFILRVEDTDQARVIPGALEAIFEGLRWLGLDWQEGPQVDGPFAPYIQSERAALGIYADHGRQLVDHGWAYECYCPPARLDEVRKQLQAQKLPPMYDRWCRNPDQRTQMAAQNPGAKPVVRFAIPQEPDEQVTFNDFVRGEISVAASTLDDFVLLKSDGFPTYHLANVVDDRLMEISHVIRGDEWLPSTPRHVLLYRAFSWEDKMPVFVHLPLILGPDRAKLSKRHGSTSIADYRKEGYLPEVMINFLALLGWALDDKTEIIEPPRLIRNFTLERIGKTAAVFNKEKLDWMNGVYLREMDGLELADRVLLLMEAPEAEGGLPDAIPRPVDEGYLARIMPLVQERMRVFNDAAPLIDLFFDEAFAFDDKARKTLEAPEAARPLQAALERLERQQDWSHPGLEALLRPMAEEFGLKTGPFFGLLRAAITGRTVSPPLFESMEVLGKSRCLARLGQACQL